MITFQFRRPIIEFGIQGPTCDIWMYILGIESRNQIPQSITRDTNVYFTDQMFHLHFEYQREMIDDSYYISDIDIRFRKVIPATEYTNRFRGSYSGD